MLDEATTCFFWLSDKCFQRDEYAEAIGYLDKALALTRKRGDRPGEWSVLAELTYPQVMLGRWDEAQEVVEGFSPDQIDAGGLLLSMLQSGVEIRIGRGELDEARETLSLFARLESSTDMQELSGYLACRAALRRAEGALSEALADGRAAVEAGRTSFGMAAQSSKLGIVEAIEAAFGLEESAKIEELLTSIETIPAGSRPPYLDAHAERFRARLSEDGVGYKAAAAGFRELGIPFWLAATLLEQGEEKGLAEAREIFEQLGATPWIERVDVAIAQAQRRVPV